MSDVTVAPPSAAPAPAQPQAAPQQHEVPINQNPVNSPNPVGPQAPDKQTNGNDGRREAIQRAFDRANNPPPKTDRPAPRPAPKAAEAKPGHNQPPEQTPPEKLDLKRRPDDQPRSDRNERGQFAPKQAREQTETAAAGTQPQSSVRTLPNHAPYPQPLPRMAESAKRDWHATPETVRGDVHRMHAEFTKASNYYKATHEAFKPIAKYHQMAQEQGTTLEQALGNYVSMEQKLRADPIAGLDTIVNNLGLKTPDGQQLGLRDIAYHVLSQTPEQLRQIQQGNQQTAASHQIGALHQEIQGLKSTLQQMHTRQQFTYTRSAVDQFAAGRPRFDELGAIIEQELKLGFDLNTAYRRAELLRPAAQAPQTRTTPAQTRPTDRSIHGAPSVAPSNGADRRPREASRTPRDAVQNAINRYAGRA